MMDDNRNNRLLFIDTETGGTDPKKHSLLSIGLAVWDVNDGIIESKELFVKNDEYVITNTAQKINKFDKELHEQNSQSRVSVIRETKKMISKHFPKSSLVTLAGHNVQFDIGFLKELYSLEGVSFSKSFSHRAIDTYSILRYLFYTGKITDDISSSAKAFSYFKIKVSNRHSALGDVLATVELFEKLMKVIGG